MDLELLRGFVSIVEAGSFTAASNVTGIPKSTLSRRLQEFEESLELRLIERSTRSLRLTSDGSLLYERARHLISEANELEHLMRDRDKTPKGHLRIAVPILFGQSYLGSISGEYTKRWPETTMDVHMSDRQVDLIEEDFDCAIRVGPLNDSSMIAQIFAETYYVVVASPSLDLNHCHQPNDLKDLPTIQFLPGSESRPWIIEKDIGIKGSERLSLQLSPNVSLSSMFAVRDACRAGGGVSYMPEFLVRNDISSGVLNRVLPQWQGPKVQVSLVYPSRRNLSARVKAFKDLLIEVFKERAFPSVN